MEGTLCRKKFDRDTGIPGVEVLYKTWCVEIGHQKVHVFSEAVVEAGKISARKVDCEPCNGSCVRPAGQLAVFEEDALIAYVHRMGSR